ncbi:MAG: HDOD domain-containing protein [Gammaproteobacteria bacterium]|nr:HDOD domain-containing protein [Gammaproteobacteria bacterium]
MAYPAALKSIRPTDLPMPAQAAIRILQHCSQAHSDSNDLARIAGSDPQLAAELLRVVNSAFFGLSKNVKTVQRAVTVLGRNTLRNLVLCISVRSALQSETPSEIDITAYWEEALRRAVSARLLGELLHLDGDECFTAGLLQDFGLLVMFVVLPQHASAWQKMCQLDPDTRLAEEQTIFTMTHTEVGAMLGEAWQLPQTLVDALNHHHAPDDTEQTLLSKLLYCVDWIAALYNRAASTATLERCSAILATHLDISQQQLEALLKQIPAQVEAAAEALGLNVSAQADLEQILRDSNLQLAAANLSYQELTWQLENTIKERDHLAAALNRELELAREVQRSLLPAAALQPSIAAINIAAGQLSGDFYDYFSLNDGRIYFNLGDVSGKGVNAALLMAKTSSLFHCLGKHIDNPGELLEAINNELCETSVYGMFVTLIAGLYSPATGQIQLVNAGHPPALLIKKGAQISQFSASAPPLGIIPNSRFPEVELTLTEGCLYLYSDGLTESCENDTPTTMRGLKGLLKLIAAAGQGSPEEKLNSIMSAAGNEQETLHDDMTMLLIQHAQSDDHHA